MAETIVLLGVRDEESHLSRRAHDFGWSAEPAANLDELRCISSSGSVVAVYFDPRYLQMSWQRVLGHVMRAAPHAFPIVCSHFSDRVSVDQFTAEGGFYVLHVPFADHEVQQSLGFVHAALSRRPAQPFRRKNATAQAG